MMLHIHIHIALLNTIQRARLIFIPRPAVAQTRPDGQLGNNYPLPMSIPGRSWTPAWGFLLCPGAS